MKLYPYLKSILEEDRCAVVICNLKHEIIYMNPAAKEQYVKWGGGELLGRNLLECHNDASREMIRKVVECFRKAVTTIESIPLIIKRKIRTYIW